ncbi:helix-turn-helix domain-containing protein [Ruminococcaceae bacterium OttesenSCG-928-D13]|nr:helix-turn-helix domain-containing protein [Ruminococcaceae bacterium OttesenSCG-928-D13]
MKKYESLKRQYPEYISLNQLYQICRVSKRGARYLLQNGIIPCIENESNATWRYKIALDDVITYLRRREQWGSLIPRGALKSPKKGSRKKQPPIFHATENELTAYFSERYASYPDILATSDVSAMTGLHRNTIRKLIRENLIEVINQCDTYLIPKPCLIEFVKGPKYTRCKSPSEDYKKVIGGFEIWKAAR